MLLVNIKKLKKFIENMKDYSEFDNDLVFNKSGMSRSTTYKVFEILLDKKIIKKTTYIKNNRVKIRYINNRLKMKQLLDKINKGGNY